MKKVSIDELAIIVAEDFMETIRTFEFESFREMKDCYDWTSKDIREEVEYTIHSVYDDTGWEMMDDSDLYHFTNGTSDDSVTYKSFISKVYSNLKTKGLY